MLLLLAVTFRFALYRKCCTVINWNIC